MFSNRYLCPLLAAIMGTKEGKEARELFSNEGKELVPVEVLQGAPVRMAGSRESFFIVLGSAQCQAPITPGSGLSGKLAKNASILLFAGGNCLSIERTKHLGYRDIQTDWSSAAGYYVKAFYRYTGQSYKLWRRKAGQLKK